MDHPVSLAVSWRAVSDDGHPISATIFFAVGKTSGTIEPALPDAGDQVVGALWAARLMLFVGLIFGVGGAGFRVLAEELPQQAVTVGRVCLFSGIIASVAVVGLQGLDLLGLTWTDLLEAAPWQRGFASPYGSTALSSACALVGGLARAGAMGVELRIRSPDQTPLKPKSVRITLRPPGSALGPLVRNVDAVGPGEWRASKVSMPAAGLWSVQVAVRMSDFQLVKLEGPITIAAAEEAS